MTELIPLFIVSKNNFASTSSSWIITLSSTTILIVRRMYSHLINKETRVTCFGGTWTNWCSRSNVVTNSSCKTKYIEKNARSRKLIRSFFVVTSLVRYVSMSPCLVRCCHLIGYEYDVKKRINSQGAWRVQFASAAQRTCWWVPEDQSEQLGKTLLCNYFCD